MNTKGTLHFFIGKMGAGKTTFSRKLSDETDAVLVSEDDWLTQLYPDEINNLEDYLNRHIRLLAVMRKHVQQILESGSSVVLDFPGNTFETRKWFLSVSEAAEAPHVAHDC